MNIYEALRMLELNGGHICRDDVSIHWRSTDAWDDLQKHHATLNISDLTAIDWKHIKAQK